MESEFYKCDVLIIGSGGAGCPNAAKPANKTDKTASPKNDSYAPNSTTTSTSNANTKPGSPKNMDHHRHFEAAFSASRINSRCAAGHRGRS